MTVLPRRRSGYFSVIRVCLLAGGIGLGLARPAAGAGVIVGRVDVTPSAGSFAERPKTKIVGATPGSGLIATGNNRGDWAIGVGVDAGHPKALPLRQDEGVAMVSLNELVPQEKRGGLEVCGPLTLSQASTLVPGSFWVAGFSADNGVEANYDFALAWFPFAAGWSGGYVAADGRTFKGAGNLPAGTTARRFSGGVFAGEVELRLPGVDSRYDGAFFVVSGENGDNVTAVGPSPDGSGWHIRIADEAQDFRAEEHAPFSFLYLPYGCRGVIAGRVRRDGAVARGAGEFAVTHGGPGHYEIFIPGKSDRDGILLLEITRMTGTGVEDNACAWSFDPRAAGGRGAFVVETYDQPAFASQDSGFCFAFIPYDTREVSPMPDTGDFSPAATWAETMLAARRRLAGKPPAAPKGGFRPWVGPEMKAGDPPIPVRISVAGAARLWLALDRVGGKGNASGVWAAARFVFADGRVADVASLPPVFAHAAGGKFTPRPARLGGRSYPRALSAPAPALLAVAVPAGAVRFEALVGAAAGGGPAATLRFRVGDTPYPRNDWADVLWPVIRQAFPAICRRFDADCKTVGGAHALDLADCLPLVRAGIASLRAELGALAGPAGAKKSGASALGAALREYGELCRLLRRFEQAKETVWKKIPALSSLLDYPEFTCGTLRAGLRAVAGGRPDLDREIKACGDQLDAFEKLLQQALRDLVVGKPDALASLRRVTPGIGRLADWLDRQRGWPTYGGDNQRSFVSHETIPGRPAVLWRHVPRSAPQPAWPPPAVENYDVHHKLSPTQTFDRAYHVAISGDALVYGSSASDAVVCLDAASGCEKWRFYTEGPVRLAPSLSRGRVYAGCDDGFLYCLDLATGRELWRFRAGGGEDRRLMGNGRVISQWPVRCGICVAGGRVYFGAGVFPSLGTYLYAVDAQTGKLVWKQSPGNPPQGFLLLSPDRLFMPTGRTPFLMFARADGRSAGRLGQSRSWGKDLPGGTCAVVVREEIITGPGEGGALHLFDLHTSTAVVKTVGRRVVVDGLTSYILHPDRLTALARPDYEHGKEKPAVLWETPCDEGFSLLKTAGHVVVGTAAGICIFDAGNGKLTARVPLAGGRAEGLAVNRGRLYVSLGDGAVVCLGRKEDAPAAVARGGKEKNPAPEKGLRESARELARWCGVANGWVLLAGRAARFAPVRALAAATRMRLVVCCADPAAAGALRRRLDSAGLLGTRVAVHTIGGSRLPYRPYLFNLVVAPESGISAAEQFRVLRPFGGCLASSSEVGRVRIRRPAGHVDTPPQFAGATFGFRRGPLPGAGAWTAQYADASGTSCSGDELPYGPFDILWFGRPGPRYMLDRHWKGQAPLCEAGLLAAIGRNYLAGVDAYNGAILWEKHLQGSHRPGIVKNCGNAVLSRGKLYVAAGSRCHAYDLRSGRQEAEFSVTRYAPGAERWGYVAMGGNRLVGSGARKKAIFVYGVKQDYNYIWYNHAAVVTSLSLFALDPSAPDKAAWRYVPAKGVIVNPTLILQDGKVLFVESTNPETRKDEDGKITQDVLWKGGPRLTALRLTDGGVAWRVPVNLEKFDNSIYLFGKGDTAVLVGTWLDTSGKKPRIQYRMIGIDVRDGRERWRSDDTPSGAEKYHGGHGEQTQHPAIVGAVIYGPGFARMLATGEPWKGWKWQKAGSCPSLSTSAHCAFSRHLGNPTAASFADGKEERLTRATRPACLLNILPVSGLVVIPEGSSGCTCGYSIQTTLALYPKGRKP